LTSFDFSPLDLPTATFTLINKILTAMNKSRAAGIFCDIKKAFDHVNHNILLAKMEFYGITGKEETLYTQYLKDRYQHVFMNDNNPHDSIISKWSKIHHGVLQGSALGPVLLSIYTSDQQMILNKTSFPVLFADVTGILFTHHDIKDLNMNKNTMFQIVNKWFTSNLLSLNYEKTQCIQFRTKNSVHNDNKIMYHNNTISNISNIKFLGLILESTLSWSKHIEGLINKLSSVCYMLRYVKPYMSHTSLMMIYYALFHSAMSYGIIFWGSSPNSQKIFRLQKRAIINCQLILRSVWIMQRNLKVY
jgi:hypothetical protein